jgi:hypothetical protein
MACTYKRRGGGESMGVSSRDVKKGQMYATIYLLYPLCTLYIYYTGDDCQEANSRASSYMGRNVNSFPMLYVDEKSGPNDCTMVV